MKWPPRNNVMKKARADRGIYLCAGYHAKPHLVKRSIGRMVNVFVDHIQPIINPEVGFTTWDDLITRMFCEEDNLQVLCKDCHDRKSKDERERAKQRRRGGC